jgi:hypothetical protein
MALPSSGEISFGALADNRSSASRADIDIRGYSQTFASGATANSRDDLNSEPYGMDEFYSADYPNTVFENVVARIGTTVVTSNGYVDSETGARIYWDITGGGTADYTAGLKYVSNNAILLSEVNTTNDTGTTVYVTLGTVPSIAAGTNKYYSFVTTGTYTNAVGGNLTHYDQLAGGSPGLNTTSTNVTYYDQGVSNITITPTVSTGTQTGYTRGSITSVTAGDGDPMTGTYVVHEGYPTDSIVIDKVPGVIAVAMTHEGGPSAARNNVGSTQNYSVSYTRDIDMQKSHTTFNSGTEFTIYGASEGLTGAATMRLGYSTSNSNTSYDSYVDKSISGATNYVRNEQSQAFTVTLTSGTSVATYYGKAHYLSGAETINATAAFYIAPAFSYSVPANSRSNGNATRTLDISSPVGYNYGVVITSSPNKGGGTNTATLSPGTANNVYTITYDGAASYSQTQDYSRTVTVNPTVSLSLSDDTGGDNYPISDAHGSTITSGTHGVSPTLFTVAPTVVGDTVTYSWVTSGFTFTSGGGSTAGTVIFKKDSAGTITQTLSVSGNSTSDSDAVSIVAQTVTKAFTGGTKPATLRAGTTFSVTSISANYTQTVHLLRDGVTIGAAASISSTMNFSIAASNGYSNNYDGDATSTYLRDNDNTGITRDLGTTILLPPLPVIDSYSVVQDTAGYLRKIDVAWTTTHATDVTIDLIGSGLAADGSSEKSGLNHGASYTFVITAYNAPDENVSTSAAASTINPTVTIVSEGDTSFTYGDTGNYSVTFNKNFKDAVQVHVGHGLDASQTGGTEWHIRTSEGGGTSGNFAITFYPNYFAGSTFGSIVDYRVGSSDAGWFHLNQNRSFVDFSTTGAPTSLASGTVTGTAIQMTWAYSAGAQTGIQINYGETAEDSWLNTVTITNGSTALDITDLDNGTEYQFRARTFTTKTTTPLGGSESRTNYSSYSSTVNVSTIGWNEIVLDGDVMSGTSGTGYSTQEAAHLSNDQQNSAYYLSSTTLGTHTVDLKRAVDSAQVWDGNGYWYGVGELVDRSAVAYVRNNTGDILASQYIVVANTQPLDPTSISFSSITINSMTINWSDNSAIESGYKIYWRTGGTADSGDTLITTTSANVTSYNATSLASDTEHYFAVYAYRGSGLSNRLIGNEGTLAAASWSSVPPDHTITATPTGYKYSYKTITLSNGGGSSVVTLVVDSGNVFGLGVAIATAGDPGESGTDNGGTDWSSSNRTISHSSGTLHLRFRHQYRASFIGQDANVSVTFTNSGVSNSALDITCVNASIGGGGS